ncbi:hypothetical protein WDW37_04850 [Bdellovibrionota bacterium FG-1]
MRQFELKTWLVTLACLSGAGMGAYLLYEDFNSSGAEGHGPVMAKVERREAKVRRKSASSFAWNNLQQDQNLYRRDSVQTSTASAAVIRFKDGNSIELGENSLVVIDDITNLSLDFLKGSVVLHTTQGDKRVTVGKDGKAKLEELPIRLVKPEPLARFFTRDHESKSVRFAWKAKPNAGGTTLQISPDRAFKSSRVQNLQISSESVSELQTTLAAGNYFWRIVGTEKPVTEVGQFRVVGAAPLKPLWPVASEKIVYYGDRAPVQFRWLAPDESGGPQGDSQIEVAKDAAFKNIIATQPITPGSGLATLKPLPQGAFFWRIRSQYSDLPVTSAVEQFELSQAQRPTLALVYPEDRKSLELVPQIRLSWNSDSAGLEFQLDVKTAEGKEIASNRSPLNGFMLKKLLPGAYRWRVAAYSKGIEVAQSGWRSFSIFEGTRIALRSPSKDQEIYYWDHPLPFAFKWDADDLVREHPEYWYQLETSKEADFKVSKTSPRLHETTMEAEKLAIETGPRFWRVQVVDSTGQVLKSSETHRFIYGVFPPLKSPTAIAPGAYTVFNPLEHEAKLIASWGEVKDAEEYEITVFAAANERAPASGQRVVFKTVTSKTSVELDGLKPASYSWSVRAIDRIKRKGDEMVPRTFSVSYGDILRSPEVISPEVQ